MREETIEINGKKEGIFLPEGYEINMHPETITPPENCYFLRGVKNWTAGNDLTINMPEISCSLQKDGHTIPLRTFGYVLEIDKGGIVAGYDRDITSEPNADQSKSPSAKAIKSNTKVYTESQLDDLIANTKNASHNELIVKGDKVGVLKAYILEGTINAPGLKQFKKDCEVKGIEIHIIPRISIEIKVFTNKLSPVEAVQMSINISDELETLAKTRGIIISDLCPNSLEKSEEGIWRLRDETALTRSHEAKSHSEYTAPEILTANRSDRYTFTSPQSEVYSLAQIVWESLSGVEKNIDDLSPEIIKVLQKATAIKPEERYATPTEFSEALKNAVFITPNIEPKI